MTSPHRRSLVDAAVTQWQKSLIDTGRRNTLLYYKDLRRGTLDLGTASDAAVTGLLAGRTVRLSHLFPDPIAMADALKRTQTIHKKVKELHEERGITAGYLALGMATWTEPTATALQSAPAAPVLLRAVQLHPRSGAADDFDVTVSEVHEVNPVLLHTLQQTHATTVDADTVLDAVAATGVAAGLQAFEAAASGVPGLSVTDRTVIGTFTYAKLPMVNDLIHGAELLAEHDIVAALAGDAEAQRAIRGQVEGVDAGDPDRTPPQDEFIVADADSSQSYVVNAVVAGQNLVVKGPPGTGKSQTITNLVSTLIARGQRVLFVAEKRAAIDAVLGRLEAVDLSEWVMDLHDGAGSRRAIAQSLAATLDRAARTPPVVLGRTHTDLVANRERLLAHGAAMHAPREPWGLSAFELQQRLIGLGPRHAGTARIDRTRLRDLSEDRIVQLGRQVAELVDLGGIDPAVRDSPWFDSPVRTAEQAQEAIGLTRGLAHTELPEVRTGLDDVVAECGLQPPTSVAQWQHLLDLLDRVSALLATVRPEVFGADPPVLLGATGDRAYRRAHGVREWWWARRRRRKEAGGLWLTEPRDVRSMHATLLEVADVRDRWMQARIDDGHPRLPAALSTTRESFTRFSSSLRALGAHVRQTTPMDTLPADQLGSRLTRMQDDQDVLFKMPRLNELQAEIRRAGLWPAVAQCQADGSSAADAERTVQWVWLRSVLDEVAATDHAYGATNGRTLDRAAADFRDNDHHHIGSTADRVRRLCAEGLYGALDAHPEQAALIRKQAGLKRKHLGMRDLLTQAPDVLLATKPCWAMSPLVVSQVLPLLPLFDVVVFDEASQVPPADAVPSILRGKRVVVAGDERQLPPTAFFASTQDDEDTEPSPEPVDGGPLPVSLTDGFESVLDALSAALLNRSLTWHYRSQDERLIAFSNSHIYDSSLTTFPGALVGDVLTHVAVPFDPDRPVTGGSSSAEIDEVVRLVLEHAEQRPQESLGVIAMGITHADRIEAAVRAALADRRDLDAFFDEGRDEPFFVKNLERVQGDERDSVVLSVGYGKGADGRMQYRFGPINNEGGERRLNVAVTRSKRRMTLITSFTQHDLDPAKLQSQGARLLGQFVAYMASGGSDLGSRTGVPARLNPFEIDVRDRLEAAGIPLTAQYGVSGYRIDFAAAHPEQPGRMLLAIEADGAAYHSSATARDRDRLRQEHLERLGWTFHRIWSTDWFRDPAAETARAMSAYRAAVAAADNGARAAPVERPAPPAAPPIPSTTRGPAPVTPGRPITGYSDAELVAMVRWVRADGLLRTHEQLLRAVMAELGFSKMGSRIEAALTRAVAAAQGSLPT
ncbi:AAA domain-containing protein [Aquipuribacter sp. MA13-6]|uniref:AAA domain-containing protein n=1 Tax=unclassified Aquipuribacter TaxID=2635084 RepID=UPI003EE9B5C6